MSTLNDELAFFSEHLPKWSEIYLGKFVLVKGRELIGVFDKPDGAIAEGAKRFGTEPFLVKQVFKEDKPIYIPTLALGLLNANPSHPVSA